MAQASVWVCALLVCGGTMGAAQSGAAEEPGPGAAARVRVFLDCDECDGDFMRRSLAYVDFVRERDAADVHLLVTSRSTAAGGREYRMQFLGRRRFDGSTLVLQTVTRFDATPDDTRTHLVRFFAAGLAPFVTQTADGAALTVQYTPPAGLQAAAPAADRWRHWVFSLGVEGYGSGERSYSSLTVNSHVSANRITERWKIQNSVSLYRVRTSFSVPGTADVRSSQSSIYSSTLIVRSLGEHWSAGAVGSASHDTVSNINLSFRAAPIIEYNVFPYSDSSTRQLTIQYSTGLRVFDYREETIFLKRRDLFAEQTLGGGVTMRRPWGSVSTGVQLSAYLQDLGKHRLGADGNVDLRVAKGLSLRLNAFAASVHDQVYLARQGATFEEVLLRQRALATSYSYYVNFGVTYTFGSVLTTVVNPRLMGAW
jgi:hypothetical protein